MQDKNENARAMHMYNIIIVMNKVQNLAKIVLFPDPCTSYGLGTRLRLKES